MRSSPQQRCAEGEDVPSLENPLKTSASAKLVWRRRSQDRRGESRESRSLWPPSGAGSFSSLSDARGGGTVRGLPRPLFVCAPGAEEMMDFGDCISSGRAGGSAGRCGEGGTEGGWRRWWRRAGWPPSARIRRGGEENRRRVSHLAAASSGTAPGGGGIPNRRQGEKRVRRAGPGGQGCPQSARGQRDVPTGCGGRGLHPAAAPATPVWPPRESAGQGGDNQRVSRTGGSALWGALHRALGGRSRGEIGTDVTAQCPP